MHTDSVHQVCYPSHQWHLSKHVDLSVKYIAMLANAFRRSSLPDTMVRHQSGLELPKEAPVELHFCVLRPWFLAEHETAPEAMLTDVCQVMGHMWPCRPIFREIRKMSCQRLGGASGGRDAPDKSSRARSPTTCWRVIWLPFVTTMVGRFVP
jgi:hypothetical protein